MKFFKGLAILCFFSVILGSCFDPPEFPDEPEIAFQNVVFVETPDDNLQDSLVISITFKDGNGDLGLDSRDFGPPFHTGIYFQTTQSGLRTIQTVPANISETETVDFFEIPETEPGLLVTHRTRALPGYDTLPPVYNAQNKLDCNYYLPKKFLIEAIDSTVLHSYAGIEDTLQSAGVPYLLVTDTLYLRRNPNHYNIEVDFLIQNGSTFEEFDWVKEYCTTFDGRFPILTDNGNALEGTLIYSMNSVGFRLLFGSQQMKLRILVRDRALNVSNVVESNVFTLDEIRR